MEATTILTYGSEAVGEFDTFTRALNRYMHIHTRLKKGQPVAWAEQFDAAAEAAEAAGLLAQAADREAARLWAEAVASLPADAP